MYIHRCHLHLPTFLFCKIIPNKSYIGLNSGQREDSPWATLLPHRWVQVITLMVIIIWTCVKCIIIVYITKKVNCELCILYLWNQPINIAGENRLKSYVLAMMLLQAKHCSICQYLNRVWNHKMPQKQPVSYTRVTMKQVNMICVLYIYIYI